MLMPSVNRYMSREPYRLSSSASLDDARTMMTQHAIRHVPVMDGERLVGLVDEGMVRQIAAVPGVDLSHVEVGRVVDPPLCVWGEMPLDEVAELMATNKADCVIVLGGHGVQGIFTSSDALRALGEILQRTTA